MTNNWEERYKQAMREFMAKKGRPIEIDYEAEYDFDEVSQYGYGNYEAAIHCMAYNPKYSGTDGCRWIVPEGAILKERHYSMFADTEVDNHDEVGVNVYPAHCACGRYDNMTLRYIGSLAEVVQSITGLNHDNEIEL